MLKLKPKQLLMMAVQIACMVFWVATSRRYELISVEGYTYSKYDGLLALCAVLAAGALYDNLRSHPAMTKRERWTLAIVSVVFALASVMANYPLFDPFDTLEKVGSFVLCLIAGYLVGWNVLVFGLHRLPISLSSGIRRKKAGMVYGVSFGVIAGVYLLYFFFVAYPGYFTTDSLSVIGQCYSGQYSNTTPFWHTMLIHLCLNIGQALGGQGNSAVCVYGIFQCLLMAAVFTYGILTLWQTGIPRWCVGISLCIFTFATYNIAFSATMWKDIPFSVGLLLMVVCLFRLLGGIGESQTRDFCLLALGGLLFCLMRTNGLYACAVTTLVLCLCLKGQKKRVKQVLCGVLVCGYLCNGPLLSLLGVGETDFIEALAIPFQQVTRVIAEDQPISDEDRQTIAVLFDLDKVRQLHDPLTVDPMKFDALYGEGREALQNHPLTYLSLWLRLGLQHPWTYAKAWIDETQGYWNSGYSFWMYDTGGGDGCYDIVRPQLDNPVKDGFAVLFSFLESTSVIRQIFYGIGFQVWIIGACFVLCLLKKRKEALLAIPALVITLGLWVGTPVFAELRYAYPMFLTVPVLLPLTVFRTDASGGHHGEALSQ